MTTSSVHLKAPLRGARPSEAVSRFFRKYATFSGRASRSEFWWAYLLVTGVYIVLYIALTVGTLASAGVDAYGNPTTGVAGAIFAPLLFVWGAGTLIPMLALIWRRLHDTNRSGAFFFLTLVPVVGGLILLVLLALDSDPAGAYHDQL
ncbi:DUF805 domain-containing protein [Microbacterium oxydans]|uniref:DUF805 domain-containing protein n=1 Tax=Microbacterium oxydans TaxID=82380 RepID=UPI0024AD8272|nr:DUF805 domain-containing protein [Microbacterium oxydans]